MHSIWKIVHSSVYFLPRTLFSALPLVLIQQQNNIIHKMVFGISLWVVVIFLLPNRFSPESETNRQSNGMWSWNKRRPMNTSPFSLPKCKFQNARWGHHDRNISLNESDPCLLAPTIANNLSPQNCLNGTAGSLCHLKALKQTKMFLRKNHQLWNNEVSYF